VRLYLDIDSRKFVASASEQRPVTGIEVKRRDTDLIELQFLRDRTVQELPTGTTIRLGLKPSAAYTADFLASGTFTKSGTGTSTKYLLDLNLNTVALNAAFAAATPEPETLAAMLEVEWASGSNISSSLTLPVVINNDVIRGDEGEPADVPLFYTSATSDLKATQAEAAAGNDNIKWMSPLRTFQAIASWITDNLSWSTLAGKPSTFPPEAHTQSLSTITQSSAAAGQVATWNGTAWVPQSPSQGGGVSSWNDLADKPSTFTPSTHTHAAADITSGTLAIARIPTGTTSTTVCLGNDSRLSDARTPTAHTHPLSDLSQSSATTGQVPTWNGSAWAPATPSSGNALSQQASSITGTSVHNLTANRWHIFTGSPSGSQHTFRLPENATNGDLIYITFQTTGVTNLEVQRFNYGSTGFVALSSNLEPGKTYLFHYNDFETARWRKVTFA
jgi:hypothetical protein